MERRIFSDCTIPAYFQASNKPFKVDPQRNNSGQVEFLVEGTNIDKALSELYSNASVGVIDIIKALKGLRSRHISLKGERK